MAVISPINDKPEPAGNIGPFGRWDKLDSFRFKVGPALAEVLVQNNAHNRDRSELFVKSLSWDMQNDNWEFNGEPLIFGWNGELLDGQHRLYAVIDCGLTIDFMVTTGINPDAFRSINQGRTRTRRQVRQIVERGSEIKSSSLSTTVAVALGVYQYKQGVNSFQSRYLAPHTTPEIMSFIDANPGIIASANAGQRLSHRKSRPGIRAYPKVIGTFHYLAGEIDPVYLETFIVDLEKGIGLDANDPIYLAREKLSRLYDGRGSAMGTTDAQQAEMQVIVKAWNACRAGTTLKPKQFAVEHTLYRGASSIAPYQTLV